MTSRLPRSFAQQALFTAVALAAATTALQAGAKTATDNLQISATVEATCTISAANGIAFGLYDPIIANKTRALDNTGSVTTTCSTGSSVTVALSQGNSATANSTADLPARQMISSGNYLPYSLYSDAARTIVWGDGTNSIVSDTGDGTARTLTVYGRIAPAVNAPAGTYADTVVATVTF